MFVTKKQLRQIIKEGIAMGFKGPGFSRGSHNSYNPYKKAINEEEEREDIPDTVEDAWAGGENLEEPIDYAKVYTGIENEQVSETKLRKMIRDILVGK